eukprot:c6384_g1_i2.p1 GENE.c6384_g1_i2~~c6384_g1_i2.p1  ORF type:complete len:230 (+),score=35.73 c6384_g1_i2:30-692(+)
MAAGRPQDLADVFADKAEFRHDARIIGRRRLINNTRDGQSWKDKVLAKVQQPQCPTTPPESPPPLSPSSPPPRRKPSASFLEDDYQEPRAKYHRRPKQHTTAPTNSLDVASPTKRLEPRPLTIPKKPNLPKLSPPKVTTNMTREQVMDVMGFDEDGFVSRKRKRDPQANGEECDEGATRPATPPPVVRRSKQPKITVGLVQVSVPREALDRFGFDDICDV